MDLYRKGSIDRPSEEVKEVQWDWWNVFYGCEAKWDGRVRLCCSVGGRRKGTSCKELVDYILYVINECIINRGS